MNSEFRSSPHDPPERTSARDGIVVRIARWMISRFGGRFGREYGDELVETVRAREAARRRRGAISAAWFGMRDLADIFRAITIDRNATHAMDITNTGRRKRLMIMQDARYALRGFIRRPLFAWSVIGTLALGIAANVVMFSVLQTVFWRPLAYSEAERIGMLWGWGPQLGLGFPEIPLNGHDVVAIRAGAHSIESFGAFKSDLFNVTNGAAADRVDGIRTTGGFFEALGVKPYRGTFFSTDAEQPGSDRVVVLGYELWKTHYNRDPQIVGRNIRINGEPYQVVAIAPPGFDFPRGGEMPHNFQFANHARLWVPMAPPMAGPSELAIVARVRRGVSIETAGADALRARAAGEAALHGSSGYGVRMIPLRTQVVGGSARMLWTLFAAVMFVMLIACANAAQLLLANVVARRKELAVRGALGAGQSRLLAFLLTETAALTGVAGALGTALAFAGVRVVRTFGPARLPRIADVTINGEVLLFALCLVACTGIVFGVLPALLGSRAPIEETLRSAGRGASSALPSRLRRTLLVAEIALSLVLLAASSLLFRSMNAQRRADPGFVAENAMSFEITLPGIRYHEEHSKTERTYLDNTEVVAFHSRVLDRLRQVPGIVSASLVKPLPLSGAQEATVYLVEGKPAPTKPEDYPVAEYTVVGSEYFKTMGSRVRGREFATSDDTASLPVVVINEAMAKQWWPGQDAIGKRIKLPPPNRPWMTVIGVVPNTKEFSLTETARPIMYVPFTQRAYPQLGTTSFVVRTTAAPQNAVPGIRAAMTALDPDVPVANITTITHLLDNATAEARFASGLVTLFGAAATALTAFGLWGLTSYLVGQRRRELGVRLALGATSADLVRIVLRDGLTLALTGCAIGIGGILLTGRVVQSLLFDVSAYDAKTLVLAPLLLLAISVAACTIPALRAGRVDPTESLAD